MFSEKLTERKSCFELVNNVSAKTSLLVVEATPTLLKHQVIRLLTLDRSKDFAKYRLVVKVLGVQFCFSEPYQPWQRKNQ